MCFVPKEFWPADEYGPPNPDKEVREVLVPGEAEVAGFFVSGGYGKAHHWLIDDYTDKSMRRSEVLEHSRDKEAAKTKFDAITSQMTKKHKNDHNQIAVDAKKLGAMSLMDIIQSARPQADKMNNSESSDDENSAETGSNAGGSSSDGGDVTADDVDDLLSTMGISSISGSKSKPSTKANVSGGGGAGSGPSTKATKPASLSSPSKSVKGGKCTANAVVSKHVSTAATPEIVSLDGRGQRLVQSLEETAEKILLEFESSVTQKAEFSEQVLWKDQKLQETFNDCLKSSAKTNTALMHQLKAAMLRITKSPNSAGLIKLTQKFSQMQDICKNYDSSVKLLQMTNPPSGELAEVVKKTLAEVELPLPFHVGHWRGLAAQKAVR